VSTPDLALIDTDVASVLYRSGLFQRVMPAELVQAVTDRSLAISVITLGEASYGALLRKWSPWRTAEMLEFYTGHGLPLITLNRRHFEPLTLHGLALL
jgi:hypothetical protein